uniref:Uncharacterized protein n=1 Tax=Erpetoichthys calabaricus TaxID=27687 RepID=A0A8C4RSU1_ERPCA
MSHTGIGKNVIRHEGTDVVNPPEDAGILVKVYNLNYPSDFKYTFQFVQKIIMEVDAHRLSSKCTLLNKVFLKLLNSVMWNHLT